MQYIYLLSSLPLSLCLSSLSHYFSHFLPYIISLPFQSLIPLFPLPICSSLLYSLFIQTRTLPSSSLSHHYTFIPLFSSLPHTCTRTHISTNTHTHAHPRPSSSLCLFHTGSCLFADQKLFFVKEKLWKAASSFSHFMHNYRKFAASFMASLGCLPLAPLAGIGRQSGAWHLKQSLTIE